MTTRRLLAAFVAFPLLAGCKQDAPEVTGDTLLPVRVETVAPEDFAPRLSFTGELVARDQTALSFRVSGRITEILVDVGDHVSPGQPLARLDDAQQKADLAAAQAALDAAKALVAQTSSAYDRQKELLAQGFTTRSAHDAAEQAQRSAEAQQSSAEAQLAIAKANLGYTILSADAAGVVTERDRDPGELVQAAQTVLRVDHDGLRDAIFQIDEAVILERPSGHDIHVALTSDPSVETTGAVRQVSPIVDPDTGTVEVKVGLDSVPPQMRLGDVVTGTGRANPRPVVTLPWTALSTLDGAPAVFVLDLASMQVALRPVEVLSYQTGEVLISGGLAAGDRVVTEGTKLLRDGQTVELAPEAGK